MVRPDNHVRRDLLKLAGASVFATISGRAFSQSLSGSSAHSFDAAIDTALQEKRIVGCCLVVAEQGQIIFQRAAGFADREAGRIATLQTPYRLASVTKLFTTMAALRLCAAGQLAPNDQVSRHLPDFMLQMTDGTSVNPTVGQLMSHTSGLDYRFQQPAGGPYAKASVSDGLDRTVPTLAENIQRIAGVAVDSVPGTTWRYSVATDILGAVIERVAGTSLDVAIRDLVTGPLGLSVGFHTKDHSLAAPYYNAGPVPALMSGPTRVPLPFIEGPGVSFDPGRIRDENAWPSGGAGAVGCARDVLSLLEAYRAGDFLPDKWRQQARAVRVGARAQTQGPGWGYSWMGSVLVDPQAAGSQWSKGSVSWGGVYGASWGMDFTRGLTFVSLTNTTPEGMIGQYAQDLAVAFGALGS